MGGLATQITNLDLSSVVGSNGVYASAGVFPTGSYGNTNYFRDVVFARASGVVPTYSISGTTDAAGATVTVSANGSTAGTATADASGSYTISNVPNGTYTVTPSLASYTFTPTSASVTVNGANVTGVNFTAGTVTTETLFTTQAPTATGLTDGPTVNYELGTLIESDIAGQITAIRFWKDSHESGTHTGHVWSASGTLLATVTFTNETASGWQVQSLTTPLAIAANTTYVVSVNTGNTYYVASASGLASKVTNLDLSSVVGNDGVYGTPGAFPTGSYANTNYFRDVTFLPGSAPTYTVSGTITGASGATVTFERKRQHRGYDQRRSFRHHLHLQQRGQRHLHRHAQPGGLCLHPTERFVNGERRQRDGRQLHRCHGNYGNAFHNADAFLNRSDRRV